MWSLLLSGQVSSAESRLVWSLGLGWGLWLYTLGARPSESGLWPPTPAGSLSPGKALPPLSAWTATCQPLHGTAWGHRMAAPILALLKFLIILWGDRSRQRSSPWTGVTGLGEAGLMKI